LISTKPIQSVSKIYSKESQFNNKNSWGDENNTDHTQIKKNDSSNDITIVNNIKIPRIRKQYSQQEKSKEKSISCKDTNCNSLVKYKVKKHTVKVKENVVKYDYKIKQKEKKNIAMVK